MKKKTLRQIAEEQGITRQAVWAKTEKGRAYRKAYRKAYQKAYWKTDKYKAYRKAYQKTDKYKAYRKAYHKRIYVPVVKLRELVLIQ